ncbi:MAG: GNAT family N-acetyltransferase [Bacteroidota bacterium]
MLQLRPIQVSDNPAVTAVIQTVMPEFNCVGEGYSINDPEILDMAAAYSGAGAAFFVLESGEAAGAKIVGVAGYAPLSGAADQTCELRKMYILKEGRGQGGGRLLMDACLAGAIAAGYTQMYLETVKEMTTAASVYQKYGFQYLDGPLGNTGHCGCDRYMVKQLVE